MNNIELLSPVGEWNSLVSAVQNGANAVYFGADEFNARMNSKNFNREELKKAIEYAKLRNVKTNLTLNILIKNDEFSKAMELVEYAYTCGIDAIIVQDLGLAKAIIKSFPDLEVHSSTQMTVYNLEGARKIQEMGFKRCVLARELSVDEIKHICKNVNIEIEVFIHGALCICYSGQCLMSSIIGGRSGNRGKCAGTCRLPYSLLNNGKEADKGYLLSSKDVCTLDILPELIQAGVKSFKIEGRMKSPEYVGTVTSVYRKYIDLANSNKPYKVQAEDKEKLMQIFNRGGFSTGYLKGKLGKEMVYKYKPNHMGIYIGKVEHYNPNKGYTKIKLEKELNLGDSISIKDGTCKISELMIGNNNIKQGKVGQTVTIGRIYGKINNGDKVYRTVDINLNREINQRLSKENIKREINCEIIIKEDTPISLKVQDITTGIEIIKTSSVPQKAEKQGLTRERIEEQISKLGNTVFEVANIKIEIGDKLITQISGINELRRETIQELEEKIRQTFIRKPRKKVEEKEIISKQSISAPRVSVCLNSMSETLEYSKLQGIDNIYIPLRFFTAPKLKKQVKEITENFNTYLLMPAISKSNYEKINIEAILKEYKIAGVVISNISQLETFKNLKTIANYTMNVMNNHSIKELEDLGIERYTVSPETDKNTILSLNGNIEKELIVYGRTLLMTTEYCAIGIYKNCPGTCEHGTFKLKDRMGFEFPIYTDRINCNNLIYNSKITSIEWKEFNPNTIRIDILDETIEEINSIVNIHKQGKRLEGQNYTNGNLNKEI